MDGPLGVKSALTVTVINVSKIGNFLDQPIQSFAAIVYEWSLAENKTDIKYLVPMAGRYDFATNNPATFFGIIVFSISLLLLILAAASFCIYKKFILRWHGRKNKRNHEPAQNVMDIPPLTVI